MVRKYLAAEQSESIVADVPIPTEEQLSQLVAVCNLGLPQSEPLSKDLLLPWAD